MRGLALFLLLAGCVAPPPASGPPEPSASGSGRPDLDGLDRLVAEAGNDARERAGAEPLAWRDDLAALARAHSRDMATRDYFSHDSPDGRTPSDRAAAADIECRIPLGSGRTRVGVAENLYVSSRFRRYVNRTVGDRVTRTYEWFTRPELAARAIESWLESPGHRRNLLNPGARAQGIGVAAGTDDRVYITQVLC